MAKIITETIMLKFSKIVRDTESETAGIAGVDIQQALEQVAEELVGDAVVVEVVSTQ